MGQSEIVDLEIDLPVYGLKGGFTDAFNKINSAVSDRLHSACLGHELSPNVARVQGFRQIKAGLDYWSLEFGYCPSTRLRVVSPSTSLRTVSLSNGLSNHLLFIIWCLEFFKF